MYPKHYCDLFAPKIEDDLVFVGMSFAPEDDFRWTQVINPAINDAGLRAYRVDMDIVNTAILTDILRAVRDARLLLFDVTASPMGTRNGNVMYELGLAHALRHPEEVLIIRGDSRPLLFDIAGFRVHRYEERDAAQARPMLSRLVAQMIENVRTVQTVALDKAMSMLDEVCLGFIHSHAGMNFFSFKGTDKPFTPEAVAGREAIRVLLDLGALSLVWVRAKQLYAYQWTPFGRALILCLGFEENADPNVARSFGYGDRSRDPGTDVNEGAPPPKGPCETGRDDPATA
ncbi:MAG: hypothetical protein IT436_16125 [Phycisphaerales bacterium]|nr:hypothetical protein [Phycisphaerales bacterium]